MANCITCGRQLASSPSGEHVEVCPACRASAIDARTGYAPAAAPTPRTASGPRPPVTTVLIGICVAVYVAMVLSGVSPTNPTIRDLLTWGADAGPLTLHGQLWRALTSNYVHGGIFHIAIDMWALWNLGSLAERIFDRWTYFFTYTACGLAGSAASLWWRPISVSVGASGAIFGIMGALIAALYLGKLPIHPAALRGTLKSLLGFAAFNLFFGSVVPGIDNSAHIGGFLCGLAIGAAMAKHIMAPPSVRNGWRLAVFSLTAVALATAFWYLKRG